MKKQLLADIGIACFMLSLWACSKAPTTYFPLGEGRTWNYQASVETGLGGKQAVTLIVTNLAARELKGKKVTPQKDEIQILGESQFSFEYMAEDEKGIYTFAEQGSNDAEPKLKVSPCYNLKKPLRVGNSWDTTLDLGGGRSVPAKATVESVDEVVDVPAGTFKGCVKVRVTATVAEAKGRDQYSWYAQSIGLVKLVDNEMSLQLVSYAK
jgi:hypothetical protein